jgi:hydrogenase 3 maturation protease
MPLILGIGNPLRGDDGFGPELVFRIRGTSIHAIDAGTTPENYLGAVVRMKPKLVLVADAADMGASPGELALLGRDEIDQVGGFSTHTMSPALFMRQLEDLCGARILMLAVQPASTAFGQGLSREVEGSLEVLLTVFEEFLIDPVP